LCDFSLLFLISLRQVPKDVAKLLAEIMKTIADKVKLAPNAPKFVISSATGMDAETWAEIVSKAEQVRGRWVQYVQF
jgi:hypothetical protein